MVTTLFAVALVAALFGVGTTVVPGPRDDATGRVLDRAQDVTQGIYWINTSSPLAEAILNKYDANSSRWRDYLFQRYIDIFVKLALINLEKKDPERFNAFTIDGDILGKLVLQVHETAAKDLNSFLFDEKYDTSHVKQK